MKPFFTLVVRGAGPGHFHPRSIRFPTTFAC